MHLLDHIITAPDGAASMMRQYRAAQEQARREGAALAQPAAQDPMLASDPVILLDSLNGEEP